MAVYWRYGIHFCTQRAWRFAFFGAAYMTITPSCHHIPSIGAVLFEARLCAQTAAAALEAIMNSTETQQPTRAQLIVAAKMLSQTEDALHALEDAVSKL